MLNNFFLLSARKFLLFLAVFITVSSSKVGMLPEAGASDAGICTRTETVRNKIVDLVDNTYPEVVSCADVTDAHLAAVADPLNFRGSGIESLKAGDLSGLTSLTNLDLSRNQLSVIPESIFADLTNLESLNLAYNQLSSLPEELFSGLTGLTVLDLSRNQLVTLPENVFSGLSSLEDLDLWFNQLVTLPANVFSGLESLEYLDLEVNKLESLSANMFSGLSLIFLGLEDNKLETLPAGVFSNLDITLTLDLSDNYLHSLPPDLFADLGNVEILDLSVNRVNSFPDGLFAGLSKLTDLWVDRNPGSPFIFTMAPRRIPDTNKVEVTVAYGAPFPMSTTISAIAGGVTVVYPVTVPAGRTTSDEIVIDSLGAGALLSMGTASPVPSRSSFTGMRTAVCSLNQEGFTLDQVSGVKVTEGMEQLRVSWRAVCGASDYKVQWKSGSEQYDSVRQQVVTATTYKITGLDADTLYTVRVIAMSEDVEDGLPSSEVTGKLSDPVSQDPDPVSQDPDPVSQDPDPVSIDDMAQGSGGCSVASRKAVENASRSTLFNMFFVVCVLLRTCWKDCSGGLEGTARRCSGGTRRIPLRSQGGKG